MVITGMEVITGLTVSDTSPSSSNSCPPSPPPMPLPLPLSLPVPSSPVAFIDSSSSPSSTSVTLMLGMSPRLCAESDSNCATKLGQTGQHLPGGTIGLRLLELH